jgi:heme/copper-type cytochrome/quinol oxidase subunit 4
LWNSVSEGGKAAMKKWIYFVIQFVLSVVITSIAWYLFSVIKATTATGDVSFTPVFLFLGGMAVHLILTVVYILFGWKNVDEWRWWCILISAAINIITVFIGLFGSVALQYLIFYY